MLKIIKHIYLFVSIDDLSVEADEHHLQKMSESSVAAGYNLLH